MGVDVLRQKVIRRQNIQPTHRTLAQRQFNLWAVATWRVSQKPQSDPWNEGAIPEVALTFAPDFQAIQCKSSDHGFQTHGSE